jgi:hypothetical protein
MSGITDLRTLITTLKPSLRPGNFVFITRPLATYGDGAELKPIAAVTENEGLTLVVPKNRADDAGEQYDGVFRMITLQVHSSLNAVGLTAIVADALTRRDISANVYSAFYHDHLFVPSSRAHDAINALAELMSPGDA